MRRKLIANKLPKYSDVWPIDPNSATPPKGWEGWPNGKKFALVLTHDVENAIGLEKCRKLMDLEINLGFRSSFDFVPELYETPAELRNHLTAKGFEVGVHGLIHDGKLYSSRELFKKRAIRINHYIEKWNAVGFRSPSMHHNLEWLHDLNIEYDASTFDTDPFEPQPDAVSTIFPFVVKKNPLKKAYVELPYTLPQDSTLFLFMEEQNIDIWIKKLDWIVQHGGMALFITHPDYMNFGDKKLGLMEYSSQLYENFLQYIQEKYKGQYWNALPKEMAQFWRDRKH